MGKGDSVGVFDEAKDKMAAAAGQNTGDDDEETNEPTDPTPAPPDGDDSAPIGDDPEERDR